jgi:hypothetical protein
MGWLRVRLSEDDERRELMKAPDDVSAMLRLKALGWGSRRIAGELGCSRNTCGTGWDKGTGGRVRHLPGRRNWTDCPSGCVSGFTAMAAMRTWCARNWLGRRA